MRLLRAIAVGMCAVPLAFANDGPRSPVVEQSGAPRQLGARGPHEGPAITAEEWSEIEAWMKINCPNRIGFVERMADGQGQKDHAKLLMAEQYRQIKRTNYKPLQDALVQQAQAQDLIFGAQVKLREAHRGTLQHEVARKEVRNAVGKLFDAEVMERSAKVGRLEAEIDHMRKNRTTLVEEWTKGVINRAAASVPGNTSTVPNPESSSPGETGSSPGLSSPGTSPSE